MFHNTVTKYKQVELL